MADLKEEIKWENGIYQLETVDLVVGGVDGISNKQAKQLANRTSYLKKQIEDNKSGADLALATKRDVNDSYSKTEVDKKFTDTGKLIKEKLGKSETAADSEKLGGVAADKFAQKTDIPSAATEIEAGIVKLKNSITGSLSDTAVSEKAVSDVFSAGFLSSKQQNGYTKLPNGLILQWGATTSTNVIFPIAFNKRLNVSLTSAENECEFAVSVVGEALDQNTSNTGFEIGVRRIAGSPPDYFKFYWFAVGY
ncbi:hypothetical protein [uncultured Campylobacter sp.]|uniref:gp53-like domain-containing protein n=1 Tax=uncultured Campylobacter sp. TaxID=218934 RepID=UPI00261AAA1B|nr:hypothetical protein [uncultured Campylobacter sp.]